MNCVIISRRLLFSEAICKLLNQTSAIHASTLSDLSEYFSAVRSGKTFDALVFDWNSPRSRFSYSVEEIRIGNPHQKFGVLFDGLDSAMINRVIIDGASGVFLSTYSIEYFSAALMGMTSGEASLSSAYWFAMRQEVDRRRARLTDREFDILHDLSRGLSSGEIAELNGIGLSTVKLHVMTICRKIGVGAKQAAQVLKTEKGDYGSDGG